MESLWAIDPPEPIDFESLRHAAQSEAVAALSARTGFTFAGVLWGGDSGFVAQYVPGAMEGDVRLDAPESWPSESATITGKVHEFAWSGGIAGGIRICPIRPERYVLSNPIARHVIPAVNTTELWWDLIRSPDIVLAKHSGLEGHEDAIEVPDARTGRLWTGRSIDCRDGKGQALVAMYADGDRRTVQFIARSFEKSQSMLVSITFESIEFERLRLPRRPSDLLAVHSSLPRFIDAAFLDTTGDESWPPGIAVFNPELSDGQSGSSPVRFYGSLLLVAAIVVVVLRTTRPNHPLL